MVEFNLEVGKSFEPSAVRDAVKAGMRERDAVWLSAKERTFDTYNNNNRTGIRLKINLILKLM